MIELKRLPGGLGLAILLACATGCTSGQTSAAGGPAGGIGIQPGAGLISNNASGLIANNASGLIANNAGGLVGTVTGPSAGLISNNASGLIANNAGGLIANNAGGLIANNAGGLIANNAGGLIANNAGGYHVTATDERVSTAEGADVCVYDEHGNQLCDGPVKTDASGKYRFEHLKPSGPVVFVKATFERGGQAVSLTAGAQAPRNPGQLDVALDPASTLVAKKTLAMVAAGAVTSSAVKAESLAALARTMGPAMSDRALVAASILEEPKAAGSFDAMLQESAQLNAAVNQAIGATDAAGLLARTPGSLITPTDQPTGRDVTTFAGTGEAAFTNGDRAAARFNGPSGVALDAAGNLYVADAGNHRIRVINAAGLVKTFAGADIAGAEDGSGPDALFNSPEGLAIGASGVLYVADTGNNMIRRITAEGAVSTIAGGKAGHADGIGASASFVGPRGLVLDAAGNLYCADTGNNRIRKIAPDGTVTTVAGGEVGFADGVGVGARFNGPRGLAIDGKGRIVVADTGNHCIRAIGTDGSVTTIAGSNAKGYANGEATLARFTAPSGLVFGKDGTLYIADTGNYRVRQVTFGADKAIVTTVAGSGKSGTIDAAGSGAQFGQPEGIAVQSDGEVVVSDRTNNRIRRIQ